MPPHAHARADGNAVDRALTVVQAEGNTNNGSADWTYSVPDSAFDFLADGEILTLTYTATVNDGHGGIATKPLTVTVTGTNDAVAISGAPQMARSPKSQARTVRTTADTATGTINYPMSTGPTRTGDDRQQRRRVRRRDGLATALSN